jgi:predicted nucleic acid-binding protein
MKYLIDSNSVAKFLLLEYPVETISFLNSIWNKDTPPLLSFVSKIELLAYNPPQSNPTIKAYKDSLHFFVAQSEILLIDEAIIQEAIRIRKTTKVKLPDCIIGATAIVNDLTLLSSNAIDFDKMKPLGLDFQYIAPL